jgi:serine phosphatase RsbU (regulator of sigma subunit)
MLSLSQRHRSPRALLIDANRILSQQLDSRSFITMTYAVIDLERRTLTHARAGHCPLLHLPAANGRIRRTRTLTPDGLVLGLQIDNGETFDRLLEEVTIPLGAGDLFVLYTDGVTEATNDAGEWFGDQRLATLIEEHGTLPFDQLREQMRREFEVFAGDQAQHDDMTWVLVRVE